MPRHLGRRPGFLLAGFLLGVLVMVVGVYVYYQSATGYRELQTVARTVNLPPEALRLEELEGDSVARVALDDVALLGAHGDTVAYAPTMHFRLLLPTLSGDGPVELTQVVLDRPYLNLVERPDGSYNLAEVVAMTARGQRVSPPDQGKSYGFLLRDVRIRNGRLRLVTPWEPDSVLGAPNPAAVRLASVGGRTVQVRSATDLDARLPTLRFGGDEGWRVEVASLTAQLHGPDVRIRALSGFAEAGANGAIRFAVTTLRAGNSVVDGEGTVNLAGETPRFDVRLRAHPVQLADLRWAVPSLPAGGTLTGSFALQSRQSGRMAVRGSGVELTAYGSHLTGHFAALVGGGVPASFYDTQLSLRPFLLSTLDSLGY
ncbi:MAG TPA: hypothetical protein VFI96_00015, partial [Longimicrobiaceae bacterium]|nr:hypothetical protein [Longimicrobiaceae bacterium]